MEKGIHTTTIVVAEDHHIVRQGLLLLLQAEAGFRVVGEAGDGLQALRLAETLQPDILLLDLMIPRVHGLEVIRQLHRDQPATRIIVLSMHKEESYVIEALHCGACGYVLKDSTGSDLIEAVRRVRRGQRYLSSTLGAIEMPGTARRGANGQTDLFTSLTNRERLVLQLAAEGLSSKEIGARLFISPRTAETHRAKLMRKLYLHSQTDLVRFAIRRQIIAA